MPKDRKEVPLPSQEQIKVYFDELYYAITNGEPIRDEEGYMVPKLMSQEALEFFKYWIEKIEHKNNSFKKGLKRGKQDLRDLQIAQLVEQVKKTTTSLEEAFAIVSEMHIIDRDGKPRSLGLGTEAISKIYNKNRDYLKEQGGWKIKEEILQSLLASSIEP